MARSNQFSKYASTPSQLTLAKRLKRVERQTAANRPEMMMKTFSHTADVLANNLSNSELTNIGQGDSIEERAGNRIRVWKIEIRGWYSVDLTNHIIIKHVTSNPTTASFTGGAFSFLDEDSVGQYTEKAFLNNYYLNQTNATFMPLRKIIKFPRGHVVKFAGAGGSSVDNGILYTCVNNTGTAKSRNVNIRIFYTDA